MLTARCISPTVYCNHRKLKQSGQEPTPEECTQYVGLDCEMVGVGFGGKTSVLAQVYSIAHACTHCLSTVTLL
jgi:hypothetical protein